MSKRFDPPDLLPLLTGGVKCHASIYVPDSEPTKAELRRWKWWGRFFGRPKPRPQRQILMIGDEAWMRPDVFEKLRLELSRPTPGTGRAE